MGSCCGQFEAHLGDVSDDENRVFYHLFMPLRPLQKRFFLKRASTDKLVQISTCPWCGSELAQFPRPPA
jgi:hypothetical protein